MWNISKVKLRLLYCHPPNWGQLIHGLWDSSNYLQTYTRPPYSYAAYLASCRLYLVNLNPGNTQSEIKHGLVHHRHCHQDSNPVLSSTSQLVADMLTTVYCDQLQAKNYRGWLFTIENPYCHKIIHCNH